MVARLSSLGGALAGTGLDGRNAGREFGGWGGVFGLVVGPLAKAAVGGRLGPSGNRSLVERPGAWRPPSLERV